MSALAAHQEIFIGIVAPVGVEYGFGVNVLQNRLRQLGFAVEQVRLSGLIESVPGVLPVPTGQFEDERIWKLMKAGNEARQRLESGAALAQLAVLEVRRIREKGSTDPDRPVVPTAYLFLSHKNPREIEFLRVTYGSAFVLISFFEPRAARVTSLAKRIAQSRSTADIDGSRGEAEELVRHDEKDSDKLGQRVSDSFPAADFFVSSSNRAKTKAALDRFVDVLFGHPYHTPEVDEYGMFLAWGVSLRSADLSRQVGAAVCDSEGNLVSVGCNDVPKAGGGQYWPGSADARDFQIGYESSAKEKRRLVGEIMQRLEDAGWLTSERVSMNREHRLNELIGDVPEPVLAGASATSLLEYGRIVHAEMAAIADAARRGISLQGKTLYTTTFPCHMCARHIVAAGICRVVYIEPYPKSRAQDLHGDSIAIDDDKCVGKVHFESFTGIAPRTYGQMFQMPPRKQPQGMALPAEPSAKKLRLRPVRVHYLFEEAKAANDLRLALAKLQDSVEDGSRGPGGEK